MTSRANELAAKVNDPAIIAQAYAAARTYPYLNILCPHCDTSVPGSSFEEHFKTHEDQLSTDIPAHWEAL